MVDWRRLSIHELRRENLRRGHGDGPHVLWCNSGCKGSWILTSITAPLTLFHSNPTPSYVSVLLIPLSLNCRTLNVLSSLICSTDGAGVGDGGVDFCFFRPSRGRMSNLYFSDTVLHLRVRNISHAPIQNILHAPIQNISHAPIQNIWCTGRLLLD